MKLHSDGIQNGTLAAAYGSHGLTGGKAPAALSPPLRIEGAPAGTVSYALFMEDKDAIPVCGFSWIHWAAANITAAELPAGISAGAGFVQGVNSSVSIQAGQKPRAEATGYDPPAPPNAPHCYEIHVFALDTLLEGLEEGFTYNELYWKMEGHILESATLKAMYHP